MKTISLPSGEKEGEVSIAASWVRRVARRAEDGFRLDRGALEDLEGVSVVFFCNPNNPTGEALGREEVLEVAARVGRAGAVLVVALGKLLLDKYYFPSRVYTEGP